MFKTRKNAKEACKVFKPYRCEWAETDSAVPVTRNNAIAIQTRRKPPEDVWVVDEAGDSADCFRANASCCRSVRNGCA